MSQHSLATPPRGREVVVTVLKTKRVKPQWLNLLYYYIIMNLTGLWHHEAWHSSYLTPISSAYSYYDCIIAHIWYLIVGCLSLYEWSSLGIQYDWWPGGCYTYSVSWTAFSQLGFVSDLIALDHVAVSSHIWRHTCQVSQNHTSGKIFHNKTD